MAIVVRCPDCGKRARLPDSEAGTNTVCAACGREFSLPARQAQPPVDATTAAPPPPIFAETETAPTGGLGAGAWAVIGASGVIIVLLLGAFLFLSYVAKQANERKLGSDLKSKVDARAASFSPPPVPPIGPAPTVNPQATTHPTTAPVQADAGTARPPPIPQTPPPVKPAPPVIVIPPPPPKSTRPPVRPVADANEQLSDEQIGQAIQRGVDFLIGEFDPKACELRDGLNTRPGRIRALTAYHDGADVVCVYALLQCGEAINDPRLNIHGPFMTGCIEAIKVYPLNDRFGTYSHGLRATALALKSRKEDQKTLKNDVNALLKAENKGAFGYYDISLALGKASNKPWDNSNSQYGLLGIWSGAEADPPVEVPTSFWAEVESHWTGCQSSDGQWTYMGRQEGGQLTMTCAGLASMFVCHDWLDGPKFGAVVGREPFSPSVQKGLEWLERGDNAVAIDRTQWWGYALYGVERVGLASGFKFFGSHNWYPELAREVLQRQRADGSWGRGEDVVDTAYALLFLSRGRHPILMNKLRYEGHWANRPRDAANLAKYATAQLERAINWQVVPLSADWTQWMDSPILSLSNDVAPTISDADVDKIRQYILAGGMLYVQADGDAPAMSTFATELAHRLFPMYELANVPPSHPLFSSVYKLSDPPPLKMISNGSRILMLFSPTDLAKHWQLREQRTTAGKPVFQLGINMFVYATGRRDLRNRLDTNVIARLDAEPSMTVKIARVTYNGAWDPEPYAWTRFSRWFQKGTGYALDVHAVPMRNLDASTYPFAHLTGAFNYLPTADEVAAVKKYVESGGVLLIDMTGGTGTFDDNIRTSLLSAAFPGNNSNFLHSSHPLLRAGPPGMEDLARIRLRPYTVEKLGTGGSNLELYKAGKGHVLFTSLDISSGLLNTGTWGILGYEPGYAQNVMKNSILWTVDGQKEE